MTTFARAKRESVGLRSGPGVYAGSCKSLNLNLGEGEPRTALAYISFEK